MRCSCALCRGLAVARCGHTSSGPSTSQTRSGDVGRSGRTSWQAKHLRWYLTTQTEAYTHGTRYRHWLTVRALVSALGKGDHWLPHLQGPWLRPTGEAGALKAGRPPKLPR